MHLSGPCLQSENHLNYSHLVCLTLQGTILCCHPQFFFSVDIITLAIVWATGVSDCWVWLLGLLLGKQWILFDLIFLLQRDASRGFSSDHNCPLSGSEMICPHETNKQTNRSLQMIFVCEKNTWLHMLVWVSFFHIVWAFLFLCLCMCVCVCIRLGTDLSSSWQTPSTATAGPQPVDAERPKLQERSRGPKIFPWPLKALLIFTVSCF